MSGLTMPKKGEAARLLSDLNAEHSKESGNERYNVTTLQETLEDSNVETNEPLNAVTVDTANVSINEPAFTENVAVSNVPYNKGAKKPSSASSRERRKEASLPSSAQTLSAGDSGERGDRAERLEKAMQIAHGDELDVATIRVSAKLHAYLERYVERINRLNPKGRYRKQDAIEAAFAAFYADHPMPPAPVEEEL
jgi:hypothetical protein